MNSDNLLKEFIRHLQVERGLSPATWNTYQYHLRGYLRFLDARYREAGSSTREDILAYLENQKAAGLKDTSLFGLAIAIRQFHRFLRSESHAATDPTAGMRLPKFKQRLPEPLSVVEIEKLLSNPGVKFNAIRNHAMLETMYATGVRVSELIGLKIDQVNLEEGWLRVLGKGGRERCVPFGNKAKDALLRYLEARTKRFSLPQDTLFLNSRGQGLTRGGFWWQLKRMARRSGIPGRVTPHVVRHSAATAMLEGGASIRVIQEMLGHSNLSTTIQRYAHVSPEFLRRACEKAHPRF